MKYILIILIALIINGCGYGQYPIIRYLGNDYPKVVHSDTIQPIETITAEPTNTDNPYVSPFPNSEPLQHGGFFANLDSVSQIDSAKYYKSKQTYWEKKYDKEFKRLNRTGHKNDISESLLMFQDSAIRYKLLLYNYKK